MPTPMFCGTVDRFASNAATLGYNLYGDFGRKLDLTVSRFVLFCARRLELSLLAWWFDYQMTGNSSQQPQPVQPQKLHADEHVWYG